MWPYSWTHVGTPSHLGHMDRVAATMSSQAHAGAAQEAPNIGQWEGQDVPLVRPSSCIVKGGIPSSRRYLPTYLSTPDAAAATSTPITNPPMAEGIGLTGMPTYPAYGVNPPTTAFPEATTTSEPVTSRYAPRWYAADYHHPLPTTGAYVDVPGYATLSGLRR